jgi:hypothetical protein
MIHNDSKWLKMTHNDSKWLNTTQNDAKMTQNDAKILFQIGINYVVFPSLFNDWIVFSHQLICDCCIILSFADLSIEKTVSKT